MIDGIKPYPAYKDSGLPWLRNIPVTWQVLRGKSVFNVVDIRSRTGHEELLTVSATNGVVPRSQTTVTMFKAQSYIGHKLCWPGDLVVNSLWAWMQGLGFSKYHGLISSAYSVYRPRITYADYWPYFHYLLRSDVYKWELQTRSKGVWLSRLQISDTAFLDMPIVIPGAEDVGAIVRFLDHANRRIDRYIRTKKKLIALLNEQKQAIIHRAVTRGLDPNVRLKPSTVPWLGDIPEHWEVMRLKSLVTEAVAGPYGSSLTKAMYSQRGYRVYGQQQVIPDDFSVGDYYISADKFVEMTRYRVLPHDVLVSVMGTVGRVAVVPETAEPGIINPRLVRYRPDFNRVRPRYLQLAMQASPSQAQLAEGAKGTTMEGLNMQILGKLLILVPSLREQAAICDFLDSEVVTFDIAITRTEREIALIREYRTRLVADIVTGQFDVRAAAAKLPDEPREEDVEFAEEASREEDESAEFDDMADSVTIG